MATTIDFELGGQITVSKVGPITEGRSLVGLTIHGRLSSPEPSWQTVAVVLDRGELRELAIDLLRRLKGGDDVARFQLYTGPGGRVSVSLDRMVDLISGETVTPAPAEEGGPST